MRNDIIQRSFQMFHQRDGGRYVVIKRNHFVQDSKVSGFPDISACSGDEPEWIIIKTTSDIGVSTFGQWLILMIGTSVFELSGGNINDTLSCPFWNQMYESEQILAGVTESHATSDTGFVVGSGS